MPTLFADKWICLECDFVGEESEFDMVEHPKGS
jgi:hypothetical protein